MNVFLEWFRTMVKRLMTYTIKNRWVVLLTDLTLCLGGFMLAIVVHNRYQVHDISGKDAIVLGLWYAFFLMAVFVAFQYYRGLTRHLQFYEVGRFALTLLLPASGVYILLLGFDFGLSYPFYFIVLVYLLSFVLLLITRFVIIYLNNYSSTYSGKQQKGTFVYGIGAHSVALSQWLSRGSSSDYKMLGFLVRGDHPKKLHVDGRIVHNLCVKETDAIIRRNEVDMVLFPDYNALRHEEDLVTDFLQRGVQVLVSPPIEGLESDGQLRYRFKPIQFEDLLGREEIVLNMELIKAQLADSPILITGAAGSIGSELARQLAVFDPANLILMDVAETPLQELGMELSARFPDLKFKTVIGDIRRNKRLNYVFGRFAPKVVYHAAAYKHVPLMENNPCEAILDNVMGTKNLADCAVKHGVERFVMVSTDKAVNPTNVMGASKRIAEIYVQSLAKECSRKGMPINFVTTRFGNVLGSNGSVIPHFRDQIEKGGPVTVTHPDILRYFMTIPEACRLVLEAASFGRSGEIYVFDMGKPVKIVDLARKMIQIAGFVPDKDIKIEFIGLRPGEKLYEELLNNKEETIPTQNEKILVAKVREYDYAKVEADIEAMIQLAKSIDVQGTVRAMKQLVPEFKSKNSPFEQLD
jgi:FlaA1/EpsC-like NDP-sugar epimerase